MVHMTVLIINTNFIYSRTFQQININNNNNNNTRGPMVL